jgi:potassium-transporting ATPase KdpC subunit
MLKLIRPALGMLGLFTLLTGLLYPAAITGLAQGLFPEQARGSLIHKDNRIIGSALIGQSFSSPRYFWGRPSATAPFPYNAGASTGSNLGPSNPALREAVAARAEALRLSHSQTTTPLPVDLLSTSASGLDPHISPAAAFFQAKRVAQARGLDENQVRALIEQYTEGRFLGVLGEARVNVLRLNIALDNLH